MNNRKMIVIDLDGTLLDQNKKCPLKTKRYLKKLKDNGYIIVIATGRILNDAINVTKGATFSNYIISNNGSYIYDMERKYGILEYNIKNDQIRKICSYYDKYEDEIDHMTICDTKYYYKYSKYEKKYSNFNKKIIDLKKFLNDFNSINHMSISCSNNNKVLEIYDKIRNDIPNLNFMIMQDSFSNKQWIEIVYIDVSKYNAIKKISEIENILNENIIAFGDGLNDIDMMTKCGISVAMANALKEVKQVSNYITLSNNENGVMDFLKKYFNN